MSMIEAQGWQQGWPHPPGCQCGCGGGGGYGGIRECWQQIAELRNIISSVIASPSSAPAITEVVNQSLASDATTQAAIAAAVDQALENNPATQTVIQNIIHQYITNNHVPTLGITDGSDAKPGEVGEYVWQQVVVPFTAAQGQSQMVTVGTLQPGYWFVSSQGYSSLPTTGISITLNPIPPGVEGGMGGFTIDTSGLVSDVVIGIPSRANLTAVTTFPFQINTNLTGVGAAGNFFLILQAWRMR